MNRCWHYGRYSTAGQNETSIERQTESAVKWAEDNDYEILGTYADRGVSGSVPFLERPALKKLLENPELKAGDLIICEKLDRITRGGEIERMRLHIHFLDNKLGLWLIDSDSDGLALDIGGLIQNVVSTTTDKTTKDIAVARSIAGKKLKMKNALENGGDKVSAVCPPWLVLSDDKKQFLPIPERVEVIALIFKLAESLGASRICNELNSKGIEGWATTKKNPAWKKGSDLPKFLKLPAKDRLWQPYQVKNLLKNRRLIGELKTTNFGTVTGYYPAIISETDLILARSNIEKRKGKTSPNIKAFSNIFTGICKCVSCKSPIHFINKGDNYNYMKCSNNNCDRQASPIRYEKFEASFLKWAAEVDWSVFMGEKSDANNVKAQIVLNGKEAEELEAKIDGLVNAIADTGNVRLVAKLDELELSLSEVKAKAVKLSEVYKAELVKEAQLSEIDLSWAKSAIASGDIKLRAKLNAQLSDRLDSLYLSLGNSPRPYFATVINGRKQVVFILDDKSYLINYDESDTEFH